MDVNIAKFLFLLFFCVLFLLIGYWAYKPSVDPHKDDTKNKETSESDNSTFKVVLIKCKHSRCKYGKEKARIELIISILDRRVEDIPQRNDCDGKSDRDNNSLIPL